MSPVGMNFRIHVSTKQSVIFLLQHLLWWHLLSICGYVKIPILSKFENVTLQNDNFYIWSVSVAWVSEKKLWFSFYLEINLLILATFYIFIYLFIYY